MNCAVEMKSGVFGPLRSSARELELGLLEPYRRAGYVCEAEGKLDGVRETDGAIPVKL